MTKGIKITRCYTQGDFTYIKRRIYKSGMPFYAEQLDIKQYKFATTEYIELNFYLDDLTDYQLKILDIIEPNWRKDVEKYSQQQAKDAE